MVLREIILHNFWLKLLALFFAALIWFVVQFGIQTDFKMGHNPITNPIVQDKMVLSVEVLTQPADARIFKLMPGTVSITITGEAAVLRELSKKDFRAYVDLTEIHHNEGLSEKVRLHSPAGVTIMALSPLAVKVEQVSP